MKRRSLFLLMSIVIVASMMLVACGGAAATPAATEVSVATEAPTEAPTEAATAAPAFQPMSLVAPDCNYGTSDNPAKLKAIEAVDATTVKFTLCSPDPAFASKVAFSVFSIASKADLDATGGDSVKLGNLANGTGPYMVKAWNRGDSIVFVANPNYWGTPPFAKTLIFKWSDQSAQRLLELQSGTVDGIDNPAPEDFDKITSDSTLALYPRAALNIFYIGFNNTIKPFDDPNVRLAIAEGIDRQRIVDQYYPKGSEVAIGFMPDPIVPGFSPAIKWYDYDKDAAMKALAASGYGPSKPLTITLSYRNVVRAYLPSPDKVAEEIQAELAEIGVTVKLEQMESAAFIDATSAGKKGFFMLGWNADYPDATDFFDYHFANTSNQEFGTLYPDIVAEINAAAKLSDPAARQTHYDTVNTLLKQHIPMIPVAHGGSATAFKANVKGAHASPLGNEVFSVMDNGTDQLVFMQNAEPAALWCSDETDGETLRACEQVYDALLSYKVGGTEVQPGLAQTWESNSDLTVWTFHLRPNVKFSNGALLTANDVVATYASLWDASSPNHKGRTGTFEYFTTYFGAFLNAPKK